MRKLYVGGKFGFKQGNWALVDDGDWVRCAVHNWRCNNNKVPIAFIKGKTITLSHFILKDGTSDYIDHIDRNVWNNQNDNLRRLSPSHNQLNKTIAEHKPQFRIGLGWRARITINKKRRTIGYFATEEEAIEAYKKTLKEFWEKYGSNK